MAEPDPTEGTIDDPNVEDPYADLRARNDASQAAAQKVANARAKASSKSSAKEEETKEEGA